MKNSIKLALLDYCKNQDCLLDVEILAEKIYEAVRKKTYNDEKHPHCVVCYKELTQEEISNIDIIRDFSYCCKEHNEYKECFNIQAVRIKLGYLPHPDKDYVETLEEKLINYSKLQITLCKQKDEAWKKMFNMKK